MKLIKHFIRKILYKEKASSEDMLNYLRKRGAQIGHDVTVFAPNNTLICMLIGDTLGQKERLSVGN